MVDPPASGSAAMSEISSTSGVNISTPPLSTFRSLLRGRCIVMEGGDCRMTAEAREPDRKRRLHNQLRLARRLRAQMERAADQAEMASSCDEARGIMIAHIPQMQELVALTEAARGGYTLDSYIPTGGHAHGTNDEQNSFQERELRGQEDAEKATQVLKGHLLNMEKARSSVDSNVASPIKTSPVKRKQPGSGGRATKQQKHLLMSSTATSLPSASHVDDEMSSQQESPPRMAGGSISSLSPQGSKKKTTPLRKCHYCKVASTQFRRCHFWFVSGTKCGKSFCKDCLISNFNATKKDWNDPGTAEDWHCPSCLGICGCSACKKNQEKDTKNRPESSARMGERKSNRGTAGTYYSEY